MKTTNEVFFGTYSKGLGKGLFRCAFNSSNGEILLLSAIDIENPSYLQLQNKVLYGVSELGTFNSENGGALFAVDISAPAEMRLLDIQATRGKYPCHLCVKDDFIFVSNYSEGSLSIFESGASGRIQPSFQSLYHFGRGARPDRQESSHIHFAALTPDDNYLAICDLGLDKIFLYPYSAGSGLSTNAKIIDCPPGSGPRHLAFSNCGAYMYALTELGNTVLSYQYKRGEVEFLQEISTLPAGFTGSSGAAAIHASPCGAYIAASNRGHDSIALYNAVSAIETADTATIDDIKTSSISIDSAGTLKFNSHIMTGKGPRDFQFSPCGKWLLCANQNSDSVTVFRNDKGAFREHSVFKVPKPVCIIFGDANG